MVIKVYRRKKLIMLDRVLWSFNDDFCPGNEGNDREDREKVGKLKDRDEGKSRRLFCLSKTVASEM